MSSNELIQLYKKVRAENDEARSQLTNLVRTFHLPSNMLLASLYYSNRCATNPAGCSVLYLVKAIRELTEQTVQALENVRAGQRMVLREQALGSRSPYNETLDENQYALARELVERYDHTRAFLQERIVQDSTRIKKPETNPNVQF